MSAILIVTSGLILLVALATFAYSVTNAPVGFEDESGFHFGTAARPVRKSKVGAKGRHFRSSVGAVDLHQPVT